jgi:hypothetical protein
VQAHASPDAIVGSNFAFCSAPQLLPPSFLYAAVSRPCSVCQRTRRFQQISANFLAVATRAIFALDRLRIRVWKFAKPTSLCTIFIAAWMSTCRRKGDP